MTSASPHFRDARSTASARAPQPCPAGNTSPAPEGKGAPTKNQRGPWLYRAGAALLLGLLLSHFGCLLGVEGAAIREILSAAHLALTAVILTVIAVGNAWAFRRRGDSAAQSSVLGAVAASLWTLGVGVTCWDKLILLKPTYPGVGDLFFVAFYAATFAMLLRVPRTELNRAERWNCTLDLAASGVLAAVIIWQTSFRSLLDVLPTSPKDAICTSLFYAVADSVLLLTLFFRLGQRPSHGGLILPGVLFLVGCLGLLVADLSLGRVAVLGQFKGGTWVDLGWTVFTVFAGLAALSLRRSGARQTQSAGERDFLREIWSIAATFLWLALAVVFLVEAIVHSGASGLCFLGMGAVIVLAIARQIRSVRSALKAHEQLREVQSELETKVVVRTAELQRQTELLRESEGMFRTLFESSLQALLIVDPVSLRLLDCNSAAVRLAGFTSRKNLLGRDVMLASPSVQPGGSSSQALARQYAREALTSGGKQFEWQCWRPTRELWDARVHLMPFRTESRTLLQLAVEDVTDQRRTALDLDKERRFFAALFEGLPAYAYVVDEQCNAVRVNRQFLAFHGADAANGDLRRLWDRFGPEQGEKLRVTFERTLHSGEGRLRYQSVRSDGISVPIEIHGRSFEVDGTRYLLGMGFDVTEQVRAEAELLASKSRYRTLLETSPDVIARFDRDLRLVFVNRAAEGASGLAPESFIGRTLLELDYRPEEARVREELLRDVIQEKKSAEAELEYDGPMGRRITEWRAFPELDATGAVQSVVAIGRNITERKRAELERQALQSQLIQAQKMEAVGQLAGGVAHDFNNLVTALLIHLRLLQEEQDLPVTIKRGFEELESEAKRAAGLSRQLLMFSRQEVLMPRPLELNALVGNLYNMLRRLISARVRLEHHGYDGPVWLEADPGMLEQVIVNLVVNARDAMPTGGLVRLTTSLRTFDSTVSSSYPERRPGLFACLAVSDTGVGIDAATLPRIFDPLFTTKPAGKGTGLGLATVMRIARLHHAWIEVETVPDHGTTFTLFFPAMLVGQAAPAFTASELAEPRGNETLLLVEDDCALRRTLAEYLRRLGYKVLDVSDGTAALQRWARHKPRIALVIADDILPGPTTGRQFLRLIQNEPAAPPCILISGQGTAVPDDSPATLHLNKPFTGPGLARLVREALDA